jgi:hypothetical protein
MAGDYALLTGGRGTHLKCLPQAQKRRCPSSNSAPICVTTARSSAAAATRVDIPQIHVPSPVTSTPHSKGGVMQPTYVPPSGRISTRTDSNAIAIPHTARRSEELGLCRDVASGMRQSRNSARTRSYRRSNHDSFDAECGRRTVARPDGCPVWSDDRRPGRTTSVAAPNSRWVVFG